MASEVECDLLVVGGGAAGLSAAVTAAHHGLRVIVTEKAPVLGGATARSPATRLLREDRAVTGAVVATPDGEVTVRARRGVLLAAGGFPNDVERRRALFPRTPTGQEHWTLAPPETTGDGISLGESAGGQFDTTLASPAAWCPVSLVRYRSGRVGTYPHIVDRGKPTASPD